MLHNLKALYKYTDRFLTIFSLVDARERETDRQTDRQEKSDGQRERGESGERRGWGSERHGLIKVSHPCHLNRLCSITSVIFITIVAVATVSRSTVPSRHWLIDWLMFAWLMLACGSTWVTSFIARFFEYPPKWCTYSAGMAGATWNCSRLGASPVYTIQPCSMSLHAKPHT